MMRKAYRLGGLHVSTAWQQNILIFFGTLDEHTDESAGKSDPFTELI